MLIAATTIPLLLKDEFRGEGKGVGTFVMGEANAAVVLGDKGILYENDPETHGMLRRLVGSAMTPPGIGAAIPSIQEAARVQIDNILQTSATHWNDAKVYKEDDSHMDLRHGFKPERWLDESTQPLNWMPFGSGGRRCIGERLAYAEMKIFLSMLARNKWTTNWLMKSSLMMTAVLFCGKKTRHWQDPWMGF